MTDHFKDDPRTKALSEVMTKRQRAAYENVKERRWAAAEKHRQREVERGGGPAQGASREDGRRKSTDES